MDPITTEQGVNSANVYQKPPAGQFRYIRVWSVFVTYVLFCLAVRTYASRETGFILDLLVPCLLTTATSYFIGDWLYTKLNDPQPSPGPDEVPWTRRRMLNSFLSNTAAT